MFLKFTLAMSDVAKSGGIGTVVVKSDGETVYTSILLINIRYLLKWRILL